MTVISNTPVDKTENSVSPPPSNITMDTLTSGEHFPDVKENAIQAVQASQKEKANEAAQIAPGTKLKKNGEPAKPRGRKPGQKNGTPAPQVNQPFYNPNNVEQVQNSMPEAIMISGLLEQMSMKLISDEWKLTETEKASNISAWCNMLDYYGGLHLTPPQNLVINQMSIIMSRMAQKETRTKLALFKAWFADKMAKKKWGFKKKNAHSDNRTDAERENDIRKEESGGAQKAR